MITLRFIKKSFYSQFIISRMKNNLSSLFITEKSVQAIPEMQNTTTVDSFLVEQFDFSSSPVNTNYLKKFSTPDIFDYSFLSSPIEDEIFSSHESPSFNQFNSTNIQPDIYSSGNGQSFFNCSNTKTKDCTFEPECKSAAILKNNENIEVEENCYYQNYIKRLTQNRDASFRYRNRRKNIINNQCQQLKAMKKRLFEIENQHNAVNLEIANFETKIQNIIAYQSMYIQPHNFYQ
ncbi:uncharacterized protein LOC115228046 [Octopus sinensis]|uniref:Uncharacterized protein LOC115228046 n=1 Tax=Octopus sinensis TaxID=2607531 RepID=A0A6P7TZ89_9MOLL|nr:uncharacterized protein LOC115228046 [Octopus sinensis]